MSRFFYASESLNKDSAEPRKANFMPQTRYKDFAVAVNQRLRRRIEETAITGDAVAVIAGVES